MPKGLKNRPKEYIAIRDNTRVMRNDTIQSRPAKPKTNYTPLPTSNMQREQRMANKPKPLMAKAGFTLNNRRYRNGGKTKC